ncbi:MAG: hemerythrin domain-containing protein [Candidatus Tectomicrobia bacterium]|nr:hemerythrin domain-containing protein [Candidatus Tectomicrobia bacterium]
MTNPLDLLTEQHQHGLRELDRLDAALSRVQTSGNLAAELATIRQAVTFLDTEVRQHNQIEEDHLFPVLEATAPGGPIGVMLDEHRELWAALDALQNSLRKLAARSTDEAARDLLLREGLHICDLLRNHIAKEENILFPSARECLTPSQLERISWAMEGEASEEYKRRDT